MKAIETKFIPATNVKGSRVKATEPDGKSVTLSWEHGLNSMQNHQAAAVALCRKMKWGGTLATGELKSSYVHVFVATAHGHPLSDDVFSVG